MGHQSSILMSQGIGLGLGNGVSGMGLASPCCWRISFLKRFYINNTFLHLIIYNNVSKQLLNLIRYNIGLISDPQKYEKCTAKGKKNSPAAVNFACYARIFFRGSL